MRNNISQRIIRISDTENTRSLDLLVEIYVRIIEIIPEKLQRYHTLVAILIQ